MCALEATPIKGPVTLPQWTSLSAGANGTALDVQGSGSFTFQVVEDSGSTWTVKFQGSNDGGTNYHDLPMRNKKTAALTASGSTIAATGIYEIDCSGLAKIRPVYTMTTTTISIYGAFGPSRGLDIAVPISGAITLTSTTITGSVAVTGPLTDTQLRTTPVTTRQNSNTLLDSGVLAEATKKAVLAPTANAKLMALWLRSIGTGTLNVHVYHGNASDDTEIATYVNTTVPAGTVDLLPGVGASGGLPVANGVYVWAMNNDNSDFTVFGLYKATADI